VRDIAAAIMEAAGFAAIAAGVWLLAGFAGAVIVAGAALIVLAVYVDRGADA
jgi:hypothetical protein